MGLGSKHSHSSGGPHLGLGPQGSGFQGEGGWLLPLAPEVMVQEGGSAGPLDPRVTGRLSGPPQACESRAQQGPWRNWMHSGLRPPQHDGLAAHEREDRERGGA